MSGLRLILTCTIAVTVAFSGGAEAVAKRKKVEAIQGKRYPLHEVHGPHMVLVTTLRDVKFAAAGGMSAEEAADEIVYQLRRIGIPAYVYQQDEQLADGGRYIARQGGIAIVAGNFSSPDHRHAQIVLNYIQNKFRPSLIDEKDSGAIVAQQVADKPFKQAFIIANPLRKDVGSALDSELVKINSRNGDVSLLKNKGTYSVKVATFSGKSSVVQVSGRKTKNSAKSLALFDESDESARDAWELATALREATKYGYKKNYEAWVFHDERKSYVTVGSFDSPDDPQVRQLVEEFRAKSKPNPKTGRDQSTPELFSIPKNPVGQSLPDRLWFFDESPRPVRIPGR